MFNILSIFKKKPQEPKIPLLTQLFFENINDHLQGILDETQSAAYYGGTLSWGDARGRTIGLNVDGKGFVIENGFETVIHQPAETRLLVCKLYLKHKTKHHTHWQQAYEVVNGRS